jgi:hypothetical protein
VGLLVTISFGGKMKQKAFLLSIFVLVFAVSACQSGGLSVYEIAETMVVETAAALPTPLPLTETSIPPTETSTPTLLPTETSTIIPTATASQLQSCTSTVEDMCVYSFAPQSTGLIIALKFEQKLNIESLPILMVADKNFKCEIISTYPDLLYCSGPSLIGSNELKVYSSTNQLLAFGTFNIPQYIPPSPTPKQEKSIEPTPTPKPLYPYP